MPPSDEIERLRDRRDELLRHADKIEAEFGTPPPLRDRNWFFHTLLNGDLYSYDRVHPRWKEMRRYRREAARAAKLLDTAVVRAVTNEPRARQLEVTVGKEQKVIRASDRMLSAIAAARVRLNRLTRPRETGSTGATTARDAKELSKHLRAVRRHGDELREMLVGRHSLMPAEFPTTDVGPHGTRYAELKEQLRALEKTVFSLKREAVARRKVAKAERRQYVRDGKARYDR